MPVCGILPKVIVSIYYLFIFFLDDDQMMWRQMLREPKECTMEEQNGKEITETEKKREKTDWELF